MRYRPSFALLLGTLLSAGCGHQPAAPGPSPTVAASDATPPETAATAAATATAAVDPSATANAERPGETLLVASEMVDCQGEGPMKCLRVRADAEKDWELLYQAIEGFTHEAGYEYELKVERSKVESPPPGASSLKIKLLDVVSKRKADTPK